MVRSLRSVVMRHWPHVTLASDWSSLLTSEWPVTTLVVSPGHALHRPLPSWLQPLVTGWPVATQHDLMNLKNALLGASVKSERCMNSNDLCELCHLRSQQATPPLTTDRSVLMYDHPTLQCLPSFLHFLSLPKTHLLLLFQQQTSSFDRHTVILTNSFSSLIS